MKKRQGAEVGRTNILGGITLVVIYLSPKKSDVKQKVYIAKLLLLFTFRRNSDLLDWAKVRHTRL